ncbi:MAG: serine/threonine protein kinase, partial [Planctomycetes bacterium]|nr:serine/threonine protein kinase [Planctomycetota bacterium]
AAMLDHPNLCRVYDVGQIQGIHYLTMAYIEGQPLSEFAGSGLRLPQRGVAALVRKVALALAAAHARGVIHRDLKPSNIMINQEGQPIIMDFSLALRLNAGDTRLTRSGMKLGTPAYMSPEQVDGNVDSMGPACDIYSLGVILYELLAGQRPFQGKLDVLVDQIRTQEPSPPSGHRPGVDPRLERICLKAMAKKIKDRYASMAQMAAALHDYLRVSARKTGVRPASGSPPSVPGVEPKIDPHQKSPLVFQSVGTSRAAEDGQEDWGWARQAGYAILEISGCSLLGMVYKAWEWAHHRLVTLLPIPAEAITGPRALPSVRAEAEKILRLRHSHIVQVYRFGEQDGQLYFATEFGIGGSLDQSLVGTPLLINPAVKMVETLARAIHHAHEQGVVHRDLRPCNVLLSAGGIPKITGFGLAHLLERKEPETSRRGLRLFLSNYMAPEQTDVGIGEIGPATDVHALGAILYELLTGQPPFLANTVLDTLEQVRSRKPVPPRHLHMELPCELEAICLRCLEKDPRKRPASALVLAEELSWFLTEQQ